MTLRTERSVIGAFLGVAVLGAAVALAITSQPIPADAHGGPRVYTGNVGPYQVDAYALFLALGNAVDYTAQILDASSHLPLTTAVVTVTATVGSSFVGVQTARRSGGAGYPRVQA